MATKKNILHRTFGLDAKTHAENDRSSLEKDATLQVVNLGLSRTGTTSFDLAMNILGFGPGHQGVELYRHPSHREDFISFFADLNKGTAGSEEQVSNRLRRLMRGYRSAGDGPINFLPKECYAAFPRAKYVLCSRDGGANAWWHSFDNAMHWNFRNDWTRFFFRLLTYPVGFIRRQDDFCQLYKQKVESDLGVSLGPEAYERHNARVRKVIPKEQLLEYNVKEGWEPLCRFLGWPIPDEPFPKVNELESMRKVYVGMQIYGLFVWCLYLGSAAGMVYLARSPWLSDRLHQLLPAVVSRH